MTLTNKVIMITSARKRVGTTQRYTIKQNPQPLPNRQKVLKNV